MSPTPEDLTILKDDMIAFIEGHGMSRFHGYVDYDEVQCVMWEMGNNPDGWKDFVELAKSAGAPFLTMHSWKLEREELDELVERLAHSEFSDGDDVEDAGGCVRMWARLDFCSSVGLIRDRCFFANPAPSGTTVTSVCWRSRRTSGAFPSTNRIRTTRISRARKRTLATGRR